MTTRITTLKAKNCCAIREKRPFKLKFLSVYHTLNKIANIKFIYFSFLLHIVRWNS